MLIDSIAVAIASGALMPDSGVEPSPVLDMKKVREGLLDMLRTERHWAQLISLLKSSRLDFNIAQPLKWKQAFSCTHSTPRRRVREILKSCPQVRRTQALIS